MRLTLILFAAATALGSSAAHAQSGVVEDRGVDIRGFDKADRTPDWNYRREEVDAKGAYYDAGRYGPRGLLVVGATSDLPASDVMATLRREVTKADRSASADRRGRTLPPTSATGLIR